MNRNGNVVAASMVENYEILDRNLEISSYICNTTKQFLLKLWSLYYCAVSCNWYFTFVWIYWFQLNLNTESKTSMPGLQMNPLIIKTFIICRYNYTWRYIILKKSKFHNIVIIEFWRIAFYSILLLCVLL